MIRKNDDGSYLFSGDLELDLAEKELDITFPEDDSADTLGGMLINLLQRIPEEGECPSVTIENWILQIVKIEDRHIEQVQATPILPDEEEEKDE